jgi:hypothetical protein
MPSMPAPTTTIRVSAEEHARLKRGADAAGMRLRQATSEAIDMWLDRDQAADRFATLEQRLARLESMASPSQGEWS